MQSSEYKGKTRNQNIMKIISENIQRTPWEFGEILHGANNIEIPLGEACWFGLGALRRQHLNLKKLSISLSLLISADPITPGLGYTGFLGILEPFWFNSNGLGIYIETEQLIKFSFNAPCDEVDKSIERPYPASIYKTDNTLKIFGNNLTIRIFRCKNSLEVNREFLKLMLLICLATAIIFPI